MPEGALGRRGSGDRHVDVVEGRGSGFSVEAPEGVRFLIRSRLMSQDELRAFDLL